MVCVLVLLEKLNIICVGLTPFSAFARDMSGSSKMKVGSVSHAQHFVEAVSAQTALDRS